MVPARVGQTHRSTTATFFCNLSCLDLAVRIDRELVADRDRARRLAAQRPGERAEDRDVRLGRAAVGDDAEGVRAARDLETRVVLGDEAGLLAEIGARLVGQANEGLFTRDDFHLGFSFRLARLSTFALSANFFRRETPRDAAVGRESTQIAVANAV